MTTTQSLITNRTSPRSVSLRVLPGSRGAWRVEDEAGSRQVCASFPEAERLAEHLVRNLGGGQVLIYDAYLRLRRVKRLPPAA